MSDLINQSKRDLRSRMRALLAEMSAEQKHAASVQACARLTALEPFERASIVMLYMPLANEVDVTPVAIRCFSRGQTVCVPKVDWRRRDMQAIEVTSLDDHVLDIDEHGVRSPRAGRVIMPGIIDFVIVPGLAFDPQGRRLGRGGGYYDRFLSRLRPGAVSAGLVFDQQIIDEVPISQQDAAVDMIVSDRRVTNARLERARHA